MCPHLKRRKEKSAIAYTSVIPVHRLDNAIDYALDEKKCSRRANEESLESALHKALNEDKSEQDLFASACGCTCETAFEDMCRVKAMWHKEKGVQGFHLVQSFAAGEATPELAHQIGLEFADRLLHGNFQAVISTHLNTKCIHNHIVWNSVSVKDGKKYRSNAKSYITEVRRISDALCAEHHLSIICTEKSEQVVRPYAQWIYVYKTERPHGKRPIQQDLDAAVASALTWKQFLRILERQGYAFRFDRKHPTLILPGSGRTVRFKTLGKQYTPKPSSAASFTQSLPTGLGKNRRRSAGAFSFPGKSPTAGAPACGRSTFPIYTRWAHCRKSHGT